MAGFWADSGEFWGGLRRLWGGHDGSGGFWCCVAVAFSTTWQNGLSQLAIHLTSICDD